MKTVADIMTREVLTLRPEAPVEQAALELILSGVHGAPVEDASGRVVGVLSTTGLLSAGGGKAVEDAMTPILFAVLESDHALYAAKRMLETGSHRVVVLAATGRLVGVVTPMDVMRAVLRGDDLHAEWDGWEERNERL